MKRVLLPLLVFVSLVGCATTPPNLSPQGVAAFKGTQVIKALDVLRDAAIDANALTPPLVSVDTTRKVVTYHKDAITTIHAAPTGWMATVQTGLTTVQAGFSPAEHTQLDPYVTLAKTVLTEVVK